MIQDSDLPELPVYHKLEGTLPVTMAPQLEQLVVPIANDTVPVHRWFRYKEAYSSKLLSTVLEYIRPRRRSRLVLLDPYCGVGTTLVSAQMAGETFERAVGIERNPFVAFVARTKLSWREIGVNEFNRAVTKVIQCRCDSELPTLSSIRTGRCISRHIASRLVGIRNALLEMQESPTRNALLLGLAACVEPLSRTRKDGRALRIVDRGYRQVEPILRSKWQQIQQDVNALKHQQVTGAATTVLEGDGRVPTRSGIVADSVDLVLTSPPYPNNIDYSEVYKLELWLLGFIKEQSDFLRLRKSTLRSHPTSDLRTPPDDAFLKLITHAPLSDFFEPLVARTENFEESWRRRLAIAYFADIWQSLCEQYTCLRPQGHSAIVVGNSLHGRAGRAYLIPTDILVAKLAESVGFTVEKILIARNMRRRLSGNHFLRESVVVVRKPDA